MATIHSFFVGMILCRIGQIAHINMPKTAADRNAYVCAVAGRTNINAIQHAYGRMYGSVGMSHQFQCRKRGLEFCEFFIIRRT